jgi:hypothetical protein
MARLLKKEEQAKSQQQNRAAAKAAKRQRQKEKQQRERQLAAAAAAAVETATTEASAYDAPSAAAGSSRRQAASAGEQCPTNHNAATVAPAAEAAAVQQGDATQPPGVDSGPDGLEQLMQLLGVGASSREGWGKEESDRPAATVVPVQPPTPTAAPLPPAPVLARSLVPASAGNQLSASPAATTPGTRLLQQVLCPITQEPMEEPVTAADGHTYERAAIEGGCGSGGSGYCMCVCLCLGCWLLLLVAHTTHAHMQTPECYINNLSCLLSTNPLLPLHAAWIKCQQDVGQAPCSPLNNLPLPYLWRCCPTTWPAA